VTSNEAVVAMIDALQAAHVPYMLVGAYSCNVYGVARATKDADIAVQLKPDSIAELCKRLDQRFRLEPQMTFESVTATSRHVIHVKGSSFKIELFCVGDEPHDRERFARRRTVRQWNRDVYVPTAEDVLITKVRWAHHAGRTKDTDDARNLVAVQSGALDWDYIHRWCDEHGTRPLLDQIRQSIPEI
jgi:hypothetical protein